MDWKEILAISADVITIYVFYKSSMHFNFYVHTKTVQKRRAVVEYPKEKTKLLLNTTEMADVGSICHSYLYYIRYK